MRIERLERILVRYYGLLQAAHLLALLGSGVWLMARGELGVLALPPAGGWSAQSIHFLVATGAADALVAACALIFVNHYFARKQSAELLGGVALSGSLYSAAIYAYATLRTGAWIQHLLVYSLVAIAFIPVVVLAVLFILRRATGQTGP